MFGQPLMMMLPKTSHWKDIRGSSFIFKKFDENTPKLNVNSFHFITFFTMSILSKRFVSPTKNYTLAKGLLIKQWFEWFENILWFKSINFSGKIWIINFVIWKFKSKLEGCITRGRAAVATVPREQDCSYFQRQPITIYFTTKI